MKRGLTIKTGQYAYMKDGRVIQIREIMENGDKYIGFEHKETGRSEIELDKADIYGVAFRLDRAV